MEYSRRPTKGIPKENQLKILNKIYQTYLVSTTLTNAACRWSLDPDPHQTETFPVNPGAIYSQCPTWTFPLSFNYVSEKTTQQLHVREETVYAINVTREGTSPEHVSYRTRGLAASPLQSFQWIF